MPYKIVYADWTYKADAVGNSEVLSKSLEEKVEALMKKGWTPTGGICVFASGDNVYNMYQAMIKLNLERR